MTLRQVYDRLLKRYGHQHWWPAETPFEVIVGAVLTQNTAWTNVERAIANLKQRQLLTAEAIVAATHADLADALRPSGYFNIKAKRLRNVCLWFLQHGGMQGLGDMETDVLRHSVLSVNGVGPETADDIVLYAFERPVFVIDAYTRRIFGRLGVLDTMVDYESLRQNFEQTLARSRNRVMLFNEYHALIVRHAKEACRVKPVCDQCCLERQCAKFW